MTRTEYVTSKLFNIVVAYADEAVLKALCARLPSHCPFHALHPGIDSTIHCVTFLEGQSGDFKSGSCWFTQTSFKELFYKL